MANTLGERIRLLREKKHLTQSQLASRMHVSRSLVYDWENDRVHPTTENLVTLSHVLCTSTDYLLDIDTSLSICLNSYSDLQQETILRLLSYMDRKIKE